MALLSHVTQPWTVEVYDHANRLHEVVMEPGEIVYYESWKVETLSSVGGESGNLGR